MAEAPRHRAATLLEPDSTTDSLLTLHPRSRRHDHRRAQRFFEPRSKHRNNGKRIAAFFRIESLVPDVAGRRILVELDAVVQQLTQTPDQHAAALALTGVYHNCCGAGRGENLSRAIGFISAP
ncbi:MAG: hypothetical protein ACK4IT_04935 [Thioalkalivibrionaceae bacterium]